MEKHKHRARSIRTFIITAIVIAALVALAAFAYKNRPPKLEPILTIPVNHQFSLKLMAVRKSLGPPLKIIPWQHRLLDIPNSILKTLPPVVQRKLTDYRNKYAPEQYGTRAGAADEVQLLFFVDWPGRNSHYGSASRDAYNDIHKILNQENFDDPYFKRNDDSLSRHGSLHPVANEISLGWVGTDRLVLAASLRDVSPLAESVDLAFNGNSTFRSENYKINNPHYIPNPPLGPAVKLPATITHDGVNVTLFSLVSKSANAWNDDNVRKRNKELREDSKYVRATGGSDDPNCTGFAIQVWQDGKRSDWSSNFPEIRIGQKQIKYATTGFNDTTYGRNKNGWIDWYTVKRDISWIKDPVMVSVTPRRIRNFPEDEIETLEIPLPASGTQSTIYTAHFWDRKATVTVANNANVDWVNHWKDTDDKIVLRISGLEPYRHVEPLLHTDDGSTVSLMWFSADHWTAYPRDTKTVAFDVNTTGYQNMPPPDMSRHSTISLTLTSPRYYHKSFDFIAEPVEATVSK